MDESALLLHGLNLRYVKSASSSIAIYLEKSQVSCFSQLISKYFDQLNPL